jgi:xylulokinase
MGKNCLIGIDIGTQGTKAALFDENGTCAAEAFKKSNLFQPEPGITEENPEEQVEAVCTTIRELLEKSGLPAGSVAGVALDGQMAGIIGIGEDGLNVTPYDSWLDTRCAPYISRMSRKAGQQVLEKTGCAPSFNHGPKKLWWKHERPEVYGKISKFVQPAGYAVMRLCGLPSAEAFIDGSYLHFSGFADNKNSRWDEELCGLFDLDMNKLPRIVQCDDIVGQLTGDMAALTGLKEGTPIAAGCGDTVASFLSCGAVNEGVCVNVAGTSSPLAFTTDAFKADGTQVLSCCQSPIPGLWYSYAYINGGGMNLEWFLKELVNIPGIKARGDLTFDDLNRLAEAVEPRLEDPLFIPHLAGRVSPAQPNLRGSWAGLTWTHTAGHLYRALLEGVALEYGIYLDTLKSLYPETHPMEVRITGGGGKSSLWNRIKADVLDIPFVPLAGQGGAPMGMALLAGKAAGLFEDMQKAADGWIGKGKTVNPDPQMYGFYRERLTRYTRLLRVLNEWADDGIGDAY